MPPRIGPKTPKRLYLAELRAAQGLTQEVLGLRIEPTVAKGTVARWEKADALSLTRGVLEAYAEALGKTVADLYRPPSQPSVDAKVAELGLEPQEVIKALEAMKRLAKK